MMSSIYAMLQKVCNLHLNDCCEYIDTYLVMNALRKLIVASICAQRVVGPTKHVGGGGDIVFILVSEEINSDAHTSQNRLESTKLVLKLWVS